MSDDVDASTEAQLVLKFAVLGNGNMFEDKKRMNKEQYIKSTLVEMRAEANGGVQDTKEVTPSLPTSTEDLKVEPNADTDVDLNVEPETEIETVESSEEGDNEAPAEEEEEEETNESSSEEEENATVEEEEEEEQSESPSPSELDAEMEQQEEEDVTAAPAISSETTTDKDELQQTPIKTIETRQRPPELSIPPSRSMTPNPSAIRATSMHQHHHHSIPSSPITLSMRSASPSASAYRQNFSPFKRPDSPVVERHIPFLPVRKPEIVYRPATTHSLIHRGPSPRRPMVPPVYRSDVSDDVFALGVTLLRDQQRHQSRPSSRNETNTTDLPRVSSTWSISSTPTTPTFTKNDSTNISQARVPSPSPPVSMPPQASASIPVSSPEQSTPLTPLSSSSRSRSSNDDKSRSFRQQRAIAEIAENCERICSLIGKDITKSGYTKEESSLAEWTEYQDSLVTQEKEYQSLEAARKVMSWLTCAAEHVTERWRPASCRGKDLQEKFDSMFHKEFAPDLLRWIRSQKVSFLTNIPASFNISSNWANLFLTNSLEVQKKEANAPKPPPAPPSTTGTTAPANSSTDTTPENATDGADFDKLPVEQQSMLRSLFDVMMKRKPQEDSNPHSTSNRRHPTSRLPPRHHTNSSRYRRRPRSPSPDAYERHHSRHHPYSHRSRYGNEEPDRGESRHSNRSRERSEKEEAISVSESQRAAFQAWLEHQTKEVSATTAVSAAVPPPLPTILEAEPPSAVPVPIPARVPVTNTVVTSPAPSSVSSATAPTSATVDPAAVLSVPASTVDVTGILQGNSSRAAYLRDKAKRTVEGLIK